MSKVTVHEAKTNLSKLIAQAENGGRVVVCRGHEPVAMIVPYQKQGSRRPNVGQITSEPVKIQPGCFDPMSDEDLAEWGIG